MSGNIPVALFMDTNTAVLKNKQINKYITNKDARKQQRQRVDIKYVFVVRLRLLL